MQASVQSRVFRALYRSVFRPVVFQIDPERVHDALITLGAFLGRFSWLRWCTRAVLAYANPMLEQNIRGVHFANPVGLSGGFDKNGRITDIIPEVGFGFMEVGSITGQPYEGNPKPRMIRLKKSRSLLVYYGLMNEGVRVIAERLRGKSFRIPVGINIAKTNSPDTKTKEAGAADYLKVYRQMKDIGAYVTINISCPNTMDGCPFTDADNLAYLLEKLSALPKTKPIFLKLSPDLSEANIDAIIALARTYKVDGFVCSNLTKRREGNGKILDTGFPDYGGLSGKVVEGLSNALIEQVYRKTQGEFVIIGVGGIFSAEDAYTKICLGASLVELITGMVYEGPQLIGDINRGLVAYLVRDGYAHISEAIGSRAKA